MTQEEIELLFKDLCARLPYGVKILANTHKGEKIGKLVTITSKFVKPNDSSSVILGEICSEDECYWLDCGSFKPYLRPMSSMTDEEKREYHIIDDRAYTCPEEYAHIPASDRIDYLNAHYLDYRGLIPKGLAIEAPEGMYKIVDTIL